MGQHFKSLSIQGMKHEGLNAPGLKLILSHLEFLQLLSKYFWSNIMFSSEKEKKKKRLVLILK